MRNTRMAERIGEAAVRYPYSFVIAGDSAAWPDPTADAIFAQLVRQTTEFTPAPVFFANLGDTSPMATRASSPSTAPPGTPGTSAHTAGPSVKGLRFLDDALAAAEPHRVVLMHAPPHLDGHYAPQPECGFRQGERELLDIIRRHGVKLVCCAHGLGFDHHVRDGIRFACRAAGAQHCI